MAVKPKYHIKEQYQQMHVVYKTFLWGRKTIQNACYFFLFTMPFVQVYKSFVFVLLHTNHVWLPDHTVARCWWLVIGNEGLPVATRVRTFAVVSWLYLPIVDSIFFIFTETLVMWPSEVTLYICLGLSWTTLWEKDTQLHQHELKCSIVVGIQQLCRHDIVMTSPNLYAYFYQWYPTPSILQSLIFTFLSEIRL